MNRGKTISDLVQSTDVPAGSTYAVEMGDGTGTKQVSHENVVKSVARDLPLGDLKELETEEKSNLVLSINELAQRLSAVGIAYKGEYSQVVTYRKLDAVMYEGSTYIALKDAPAGPPEADMENWQYLAKGFLEAMLTAIKAVDTSGILGIVGKTVGGQELMDAIADRVMTKLLERSHLANNMLTTEEGFGMDARQGPVIQGELDEINSKLTNKALTVITDHVLYTRTGNVIVVLILNVTPNTIGSIKLPAPQGGIPAYGCISATDLSNSIWTVGADGTLAMAIGTNTKQYTGQIVYIAGAY